MLNRTSVGFGHHGQVEIRINIIFAQMPCKAGYLLWCNQEGLVPLTPWVSRLGMQRNLACVRQPTSVSTSALEQRFIHVAIESDPSFPLRIAGKTSFSRFVLVVSRTK